MATVTKFYWHDAAYAGGGTMPGAGGVTGEAPTFDFNGGANRQMDGTAGTLQVTLGGNETGTASRTMLFGRFVSPPLAAQTIGAGTWEIAGGVSESNLVSNLNVWGRVVVVWRPSTGALVATIRNDTTIGSHEPAAAGTEEWWSATFTGNVVTCQDGDVIILEVWGDGVAGMANAYDNSIYYDGTTETSATDAASFLNAPAAITLLDVLVPVALAGSSQNAEIASGDLALTTALDGSSQSAVVASGTITTGGAPPVALAGDGRTATSGSGTLQLRIAASSGTASAESGTVVLITGLVSDSRTAASASGTLRLLISGSSRQANALSAGLAIATVLTGSSQSAQADAGTLSLGGQIPISGASSTAATASGTPALATALSSSSRTATDSRGSIQLVILGAAVTASRTSGSIAVEVGLVGLSATGALSTASLQIAVALSGSGRAASEASGAFRFGGPTARRQTVAIPRRISTPTPRR